MNAEMLHTGSCIASFWHFELLRERGREFTSQPANRGRFK
jgi:hypothetical protein